MEIIIKNASIIKFIEEVAAAYAEFWPTEYARFKEIVAAESANLIKPSAMSRDGTLLNFCKLPANLYAFIRIQARRRLGLDDFFRDPDNYRLLCKTWPDLRIQRAATQRLQAKLTE